MTIEESYIRSFVAAVAAAAAVAFLVVGFAVVRRPRFGPAAMRILGGVALVGAWVVAHQIMRGMVPIAEWSFDTIGRAVWPPDVTRRFPVIVVASLVAGVVADRTRGIVRWGVIVALMAGIAMLMVEVAWRNGARSPWISWPVGALVGCGMVVVWALRDAVRQDSLSVVALGVMMAVGCAGAVMCVAGAYSLGMVMMAGVIPIGMVCVGSRATRHLVQGMVVPVVISGAMTAALLGGLVARSPAAIGGMPVVIASLVALGPGVAALVPGVRVFGGPRARFGLGAVLAGSGVGVALAIQ